MFDGLYAAASGMEAQQQQLDALSNDLSNLQTPGYQATQVGFTDLLYTSGGSATGSPVATGAGSAAALIGRSQVQGSLQETGRPLDVAIVGPGYLEVRRPDGTIGLTRNGVLEVDGQGRLTNQQGMLIQPPITVPRGLDPSKLQIGPDGTVTGAGRRLGRLALVNVPAPNRLLANGDSTFSATPASGPIGNAVGATVKQGALEGANVDVAQAMVEMIDTQQSYAMSSKAVQFQDQMLQIANQVKR